jgi:hypothetical protein
MAKQSGIGWTTLTVADATSTPQDIRTDTNSLDFATPRGVQDVTGIDKSAHERILLLADFSINLSGTWDSAANLEHQVFRTISSTSVIRAVSIVVNGATLPNNCQLTDYQIARSATGELTWKVPGVLADGAVPTWS